MTAAPRGLFVGRFQPFHRGHLEVLRRIRAKRPRSPIVLGIGSAQESYTWQNPFTAGERFEMIEAAVAEARMPGILPVPIPDIQRHALWVRYLEGLLPPVRWVYTNNPLTRTLFEEAGYAVESTGLLQRATWIGEGIRASLARGDPVADRVPPAVASWLARHGGPARLRLLAPPALETRRSPDA